MFWRQDVNFPAYVVTNIRYSIHKRLRCYYNMSAYVRTDQPQSSPLPGFCRVTLFCDVICMPIFACMGDLRAQRENSVLWCNQACSGVMVWAAELSSCAASWWSAGLWLYVCTMYKCLVDCLQNLSLKYYDSKGNGNGNLVQSIIGLVWLIAHCLTSDRHYTVCVCVSNPSLCL